VNDTDLDELLADTLHRHAAGTLPLPGDPAARIERRAARRRRRIIAAVAAPMAAAAAVAAIVLQGPSDPDAIAPIPPATQTPSPTAPSGRPSVDRPVPTTAVAQLRAAVHQLTEPMPGRPAALRARLTHYQVDSWRSADDFTLLVSLDLHFPSRAAALAWNQGANARFVHFSRGSETQTYRLQWASGP
jgi:hypothetical protein